MTRTRPGPRAPLRRGVTLARHSRAPATAAAMVQAAPARSGTAKRYRRPALRRPAADESAGSVELGEEIRVMLESRPAQEIEAVRRDEDLPQAVRRQGETARARLIEAQRSMRNTVICP